MKYWLAIGCSIFFAWVHADPIKLATSGGFAPFTDQNWKDQGMVIQILDQVMRVADFEPEVIFRDGWGELISDTEAGVYDATFPWYYSEERAEQYLLSDSLASTYVMPYVAKNKVFSVTTRMDLAGYRLCRPAGYFTHDLEELFQNPNTELIQPNTLVECFEMLVSGEVDVVPVDLFSAKTAIADTFTSGDEVQQLGIVFSRQSMHLLVSRNHPRGEELIARVNQALARLEMRGILQAIRQNHTSLYLKQF
ncbi:substrate-binding periplasmic protein [Saccharospirillum sp.]|uniref:substrate-binding periplasmic protein n=1 Tax=Saccharospirillum sp. TaxID=2033801 RepID=UPI0034A07415